MPTTIQILAVGDINLPVAIGISKQVRSITYSANGAFPRIVYINPDKDTPAERRRVIAEDLRQAHAQTPDTLEIE